MTQSWQQQTLEHWPMINHLAKRRFSREELAEEAALFVMDKLAEKNWQRVQAFSGKASLSTYLASVSLRLLEDFSRNRFGRLQAPGWVRKLGGIWMSLFRLLCLERYSPAEAVEILSSQQARNKQAVERTAYQLLGELPHCGGRQGESVTLEDEMIDPEAEQAGPSQRLEEEERAQWLHAVAQIFFDQERTDTVLPVLKKIHQVKLELVPRERLLLKLCFRDGLPVAEAGRMLGWNRHQVHGRLRRLLQKIRQQFCAAGLEEDLQLLLQENDT